jgi:hypothetical protein
MKNFWLERKPRIFQQLNPYADFYGRWFVFKEVGQSLFLHKDGIWRSSTYNPTSGEYTGYFTSQEEAEDVLKMRRPNSHG